MKRGRFHPISLGFHAPLWPQCSKSELRKIRILHEALQQRIEDTRAQEEVKERCPDSR